MLLCYDMKFMTEKILGAFSLIGLKKGCFTNEVGLFLVNVYESFCYLMKIITCHILTCLVESSYVQFGIAVSEKDILNTLIEANPRLLNWITLFKNSQV